MPRASPLSPAVLALTVAALGCGGEMQEAEPGGETSGPEPALAVADAGFRTPESVLHDADADIYLVSNIAGDPTAKDDDGFISRLSPDGSVEALRWIDGAAEGVTLHAPKGTGLRGDTLYVADIDCLRRFHRSTGEAYEAICLDDASFLNDIAVAPDGTVYISDTNENTIWRIGADASGPEVLASDSTLGSPNGLAVAQEGVLAVTFGSGQVLKIGDDGNIGMLVSRSPGRLDGVVLLEDGSLLVSTWGGSAVHRLYPGTSSRIEAVVQGIENPADIGFDEGRSLVLVPLFSANRIEAYAVAVGPAPADTAGADGGQPGRR